MHPSSQRALHIFGGFILSYIIFTITMSFFVGIADIWEIPKFFGILIGISIIMSTILPSILIWKRFWKGFFYYGMGMAIIGIGIKYFDYIMITEHGIQIYGDVLPYTLVCLGIFLSSITLYLKYRVSRSK